MEEMVPIRFVLAAFCASIFGSPVSIVAQLAVPDADQRAIELAAVRHLRSVSGSAFVQNALDVRAYLTSMGITRADRERGLQPSSELLTARTEAHISAILKETGMVAVVTDSSAECITDAAALCRIGKYSGLISLSAARIYGDSATLVVNRWRKSEVNTVYAPGGIIEVAWIMGLVRKEGIWQVVRTWVSVR
jgi:hypothetical protein